MFVSTLQCLKVERADQNILKTFAKFFECLLKHFEDPLKHFKLSFKTYIPLSGPARRGRWQSPVLPDGRDLRNFLSLKAKYCILKIKFEVINLFLHKSYLKSPLPVNEKRLGIRRLAEMGTFGTFLILTYFCTSLY